MDQFLAKILTPKKKAKTKPDFQTFLNANLSDFIKWDEVYEDSKKVAFDNKAVPLLTYQIGHEKEHKDNFLDHNEKFLKL